MNVVEFQGISGKKHFCRTTILDEFPEFDRKVIESLRQPLEEKTITISRSKGTIAFPAKCIVIVSMNPCPCGYGKEKGCTCSDRDIANYHKKISGPIVDRIDMWVSVSKIEYDKLSNISKNNENSKTIKKRVKKSRKIQQKRFERHGISDRKYNSEMSVSDIEKMITLKLDVLNLLKTSAERLGLSARAYHRIIKLSQTIADLEGESEITKGHILEALQYRQKNF